MFVEVREAVDAVRPLIDVDIDQIADVDLLDLVTDITRLRRQLDAIEAKALRAISRRKVSDKRLGLKTTSWYSRVSGMSIGLASTRVQTAIHLERFEMVHDEISAGRLNWERARALADAVNPRNTDSLQLVENELLDLSEGSTFRRFKTDLDDLARLLDPDGTEPLTADDSKLSIRRNAAGGIHLRGDLYGDHADTVRSAIGSVADQLFRQHRSDRTTTGTPIPPRSLLQAEALADLCRGTATPEIRVTVPLDRTTGELACDAAFRPIVVSHLGEPLDIGRRSKRFTDAIRAALEVRDGGCTFAGCDRIVEHCDAHHIRHWRRGGSTSLDNGLLLCRHHHRVIHRHHWRVTLDGGWPVVVTPEGTRIDTQRHGRTRAPNAA